MKFISVDYISHALLKKILPQIIFIHKSVDHENSPSSTQNKQKRNLSGTGIKKKIFRW